jgi:hypothetical protein
MATKRFGYLDDLSLKGQKVGIGTSTPSEKLEVIGGTRGGDVVVTGIATLTSSSGFLNKNTSYTGDVVIDSGESGTLSGEVVVGSGLTMSVGTGATTGQGSIKSLKVSNTFNPPIGRTNDRPSAPQPGALYYNKDFRTIEYWDGNFWRQVDHTTTSTRCIWGGGYEISTTIDYVNGSSLGNAKDFGKLTSSGNKYAALDGVSSSTRGIFGGGYKDSGGTSTQTDMNYITLASQGDGEDFGDLTAGGHWGIIGASNSTRGLFCAGWNNNTDIAKVEMSTAGNAVSFGSLDYVHSGQSFNNPTHAHITAGSNNQRTIQRIHYGSGGAAIDFGECDAGNSSAADSNSVKGVMYLATNDQPNITGLFSFVMASGGVAQYFGDLSQNRASYYRAGAAATNTRVLFGGGDTEPSNAHLNTIDYVTIASSGDALDFGDLTEARDHMGSISDCHGGLGGF